MDTIYKRIALCGDEYYEHPHILRNFIYKLKNKYGYKLKIYTRGNGYGAEKWVKKYSLYFFTDYYELNPAFTGFSQHSVMPAYYFKNKKYHYTQLLHSNYLTQKYTDELIYFESKNKKRLSKNQDLINQFLKNEKRVVVVKD